MEKIDFNVTGVNYVVHRPSDPAWRMEKILYEKEYIMVVALDGKAFYTFGDESFAAEKNGVYLFPPGRMRSAYADKENPWEFISVNFSLEMNEEGKDFFNKSILKINGEKLRGKFLEIVHSWTGKNTFYRLKCKNLVSEILYEILLGQTERKDLPHRRRLERAKSYIQQNFRNKITVEQLALETDLSPSYFRKLFKEAYGQAPMNYITALRISAACDLLVSGEANVSQAASLCGFDDIYYFSTLFKRHTGMSPTQFAKTAPGR